MRTLDWLKEMYVTGRLDLGDFRSQLFELKGEAWELIKEIDDLYENPPPKGNDEQ